ncbi:unnamed protein product [marine sediment metagenome]|uniref:Uncharacterized protein n=1 Tax=marine sediment metagenome TaxID=412755 RepID=X0WDJ1_9ZZZZ
MEGRLIVAAKKHQDVLRKKLGNRKSRKIPVAKLKKAIKKRGKLKKQARLPIILKRLKEKK